jgi:hypothetical protein
VSCRIILVEKMVQWKDMGSCIPWDGASRSWRLLVHKRRQAVLLACYCVLSLSQAESLGDKQDGERCEDT